jgi:hypothetical protein
VHRVAEGIPRCPLTPEEDKVFGNATVIFVGAVLSVLGDKLVDAYLHIQNGKELWDALDAKFGAADARGELYAMEHMDKPEVKIHKRQMSVHNSKSNVQAMCFHTSLGLMDKRQVKILPTKNKHTMVAATTETSFHMQQRTTVFQNMRLLLGSVTEIGFFCLEKVGE